MKIDEFLGLGLGFLNVEDEDGGVVISFNHSFLLLGQTKPTQKS